MKQKIMFVISSLSANGAERVMSLLINRACLMGREVLLAMVSRDIVEYEIDKRAKIVFTGDHDTLRRIRKLRQTMKDYKPDVVVSFLTTCNIYCCLAALGLNIPVIISERNDPVRDCPSKMRRFVRNTSYLLASGYIFQTEEAAKHFLPVIQRKAVIIPNPVKAHLPLADYTKRKFEVVAAGRLTKQKNYPMLIDAFRDFYSAHPEYILKIYGEGEDREQLQKKVHDDGMDACIRFEGAVKDLHERIKTAAMYVLSSDYEGISNSLLEAMAMGLPCIATDCPCGGSRHLIKDGVNGLLVPVNNAGALTEGMNQIAASFSIAQSLGKEAHKVALSHSEDTIITKYFSFIDKVV